MDNSKNKKNGGSKRYSLNEEIESNTDSESDSKYIESFHCDSDEDDDYITRKNKKSGKRLKTQNGDISFRYNRCSTSSIEEESRSRLERLPTRRPDPKIFNRNALLARENRRRKKEEMELKERKFDKIKSENKHMKELMKQQGNIIQKLTNEKLYLRSIISNRTEILSLLKTIRPTNLPITSSAFNYTTNNSSSKTNTKCESALLNQPSSPSSYEGEYDFDLGYATSLTTESFTFSDSLDDYENLLNDNYNIADIKKEDPITTDEDNVRSEHNYHSKVTNKVQDPGVCLHVSSGRVSLEFCSSCHSNAENAWIEG